MSKTAIIDIGSNSVRCLFVADGKTLYKRTFTARLGEGLYETGELSETAIDRNVSIISDVLKTSMTDGADKVYVFATAAVRNSLNGKDFTDKVKSVCGLDIDVVSGDEEAELGIIGALKGKDGTVIDIGGASTEIVTARNGKIIYSKSMPVGAVILKDVCGEDDDKLFGFIDKNVLTYGDVPVEDVTFIGGTATTLGFIVSGLKEYDMNIVNGSEITYDRLLEIIKKLKSKTVEERISDMYLNPKRSEIIYGGAVLLKVVMDYLKIRTVTVSEDDNAEGYYLKRTENTHYEK